ncbi:PilZ domain-containing protein [Fundidesulfovibrio terrae]|uniref:PilZ domain-containing protein n=1 Tax=Fundidesulfovibrio terrae TaxID=2922866 RepID=UPI001FB0404D|nr:PilZ domain-containing protein [Fundidesulfovibrio terrae]
MYERRLYARTYAQRHANGCDYTLDIDGHSYKTQLMDISRGGANFRLLDMPTYNLTGKEGSVKDDFFDHKYLMGVSYTVVWSQFNELGISFLKPLAEHTGALSYYSSYRP